MSISKIVGRKDELAVLERAVSSPDPEFIAVYGRQMHHGATRQKQIRNTPVPRLTC